MTNAVNVASLGSAMSADSSGNVGIGTSSPNGPLDVNATTPRVVMSISGTPKGQINIAGSAMNLTANDATYPMTFNTGGGERMRLDSSGNLGLGVTPSAWASGSAALQTVGGVAYSQYGFSQNAYLNAGYKYIANGYASLYQQSGSQHLWYTAPSGTAGNAITFTQAMTLDASGNLGIGTTSPNDVLEVAGANAFIRVNRTGNEPGITLRYSNSATNRGDIAVTSGGAMYFTAGGSTERMRITSNGGVAFNGATNYGSSGQLLQSNGDAAPTWVTPTVSGTAKAWVMFNGSGGGINGSFNVSSISVNGTGDYTVNFTSALSTANYAKACTPTGVSGQGDLTAINTDRKNNTFTAPTTSAFRIFTNVIGSAQNPTYVSATAFA